MAKILVGKDIGSYSFNASLDQITFSGLGTVNIQDILYIKNATDGIDIFDGDAGLKGTIAANVLTLDYDCAAMSNTDDLQIFVDYGEMAYDSTQNIIKIQEQSSLASRYTDVEPVATSVTLNTFFADIGSEVDFRGHKKGALWISLSIGTSTLPLIRIIHKHTSGGTEEYREITLGTPASSKTSVSANDYELPSANGLYKIPFDVDNTTAFIQVQAATTTGTDAQIVSLYTTKAY